VGKEEQGDVEEVKEVKDLFEGIWSFPVLRRMGLDAQGRRPSAGSRGALLQLAGLRSKAVRISKQRQLLVKGQEPLASMRVSAHKACPGYCCAYRTPPGYYS